MVHVGLDASSLYELHMYPTNVALFSIGADAVSAQQVLTGRLLNCGSTGRIQPYPDIHLVNLKDAVG